MDGWIKTHRQITEHWIFKNPFYFRGWMYFLIRANHTGCTILIGSTTYDIARGQFITSISNLADTLQMTPQKIRTFLKLLEKNNMIIKESDTKLTKISVCNYDNYQALQQTNNKQITNEQQTNNKRVTTDKNVIENEENDNNVKQFSEEIISLFDFIKPYFNKTKYTDKQKEEALDTLDKLMRIDNYSREQIIFIATKRHDYFYGDNIQSITSLRRTNKDGIKKIEMMAGYIKAAKERKEKDAVASKKHAITSNLTNTNQNRLKF